MEKFKRTPSVTTIEDLPADVWFMILEFFRLLDIHRLFFGLNVRINSIIRDKQGLSFDLYADEVRSLEYSMNDIEKGKLLFNNVWSLKLSYTKLALEFLSSYPLEIHFTQLRTLNFCQPCGQTLVIMDELLHKLKYLKLLSLSYANRDTTRILTPVLNYLTNGNQDQSLKHLVIYNNLQFLKKTIATDRSSNKAINLNSLYIQDACSRTFSFLVPEHSRIDKLQIYHLRSGEFVQPAIKSSHTILVRSLQINCLHSRITFADIKCLLDQLKYLKKLLIEDIRIIELMNGDSWSLLLISAPNIERFSIKCCIPYRYEGVPDFDEEELVLQSFDTTFWSQKQSAIINEYVTVYDDQRTCRTILLQFNIKFLKRQENVF